MSLDRIVAATVALALLGSVAVKKTNDIQVRHNDEKPAIVQLADVVSDNFTADAAFADDNPNYGEREFADANALWRDQDYPKAIKLMERVVDSNPLNKEFASSLLRFYRDSGGYGDAEIFFKGFINDKKDTLAQKPAMNKLYAKGIYDTAVQAMYKTIPGICKNQRRNPTLDLYEPVVGLLETALQLQPSKIPKGDELFWANVHYELGWGYASLCVGDVKNCNEWTSKAVNQHLESVEIGSKKFVVSKRNSRGFASGSVELYEKIIKIDPHSVWKKSLEHEKMLIKVYGK